MVLKGKKKERTETQVLLAQYFTPQPIADYMASMFSTVRKARVNVLDPGAGEGILGLKLLERLQDKHDVEVTFIELDKGPYQVLQKNVKDLQNTNIVINEDFIDAAFSLEDENKKFTHIILNPPYFKLRVDSESSEKLRNRGIQVTNIYAAFVWLSARLLADNGQLVAIIPRSFCNGPYFLNFRQFLINNFSIDGIHTFVSRDKAFAGDNVLQENVIIHISKKKQVNKIRISYSTDQSFSDISVRYALNEAVFVPNDANLTIHIPSRKESKSLKGFLQNSLDDLGLSVSTGPIVDFRVRENIVAKPVKGAIPLLYPAHMSGHEIDWPLIAFKKIGQNYKPDINNKSVLPLDGYYVVVRRFSSKEEKRRIFAAVVSPKQFKAASITFENHLNYFHVKKHGFDKDLAYGLCAYLNSSLLDEHFRQLSGHTQVNVSDLKNIPYPNREQLVKIGVILQNIDGLIDDIVTKEILGAIA